MADKAKMLIYKLEGTLLRIRLGKHVPTGT